jgi:hypothetical protein
MNIFKRISLASQFDILALLSVCATAVMHWYGVEYSLYWTSLWWDIPTHMLGGLTVGLWAAAVSSRFNVPLRRGLFYILGLALAVGVAWELWEVVEGLSGGWLDSIKDLFDDLFGCAVAAMLFFRSRR